MLVLHVGVELVLQSMCHVILRVSCDPYGVM